MGGAAIVLTVIHIFVLAGGVMMAKSVSPQYHRSTHLLLFTCLVSSIHNIHADIRTQNERLRRRDRSKTRTERPLVLKRKRQLWGKYFCWVLVEPMSVKTFLLVTLSALT